MKKLIFCSLFVLGSLLLVQSSPGQVIDDKGEWKFKQAIAVNGDIYAVEKCEKSIFGTCTIGEYRSVLAPVLGE